MAEDQKEMSYDATGGEARNKSANVDQAYERWLDLFQSTEAALRQICLVLTDYNQEAALDLFADIQIAVGRFLRRGGQIDNPLAYFSAIGRNLQYRNRKRKSRFIRDPDPVIEAAIWDASERFRTQLELTHDLRRLLGYLTFDDRRLLVMKYMEGMSSALIAEKCGMSEPAVNVRMHLIRAKLRRALTFATSRPQSLLQWPEDQK